jgi:hypothetical protein
MDEKTLKTLICAGALKKVRIIASGTLIYVEADYGTTTVKAHTQKGKLKTWASIDSAAKWVKGLGMGKAELDIGGWMFGQKTLNLN